MTRQMFKEAGDLRDLLFTMIESLPQGLVLADSEGELIAVNQKARGMLGLSGSSILGRSCYQLFAQSLRLPLEHLAPLRRPGGKVVCQVSDRGGENLHLAVSRLELKSPFLGIAGFFLLVEDITYVTLVEARLDRQKRFAAMQEMAVHMSQEIKNPLGSIELYASILKRALAGDPENERLAMQMIRAVRTMDYLLDNYVTFASLPAPQFSAFDVRDWLEETVARLKLLDREERITFSRRYGHVPKTITGDRELLQQLAFNLGLNAVESMPAGGEVTINTRSLPAREGYPASLEIRIGDQGGGISEEQQARIFDPFFTTKERANGLGLAIVHYVAEAHGGLIRVDSQSGRGSVFILLLPAPDGRDG